MLGTTLGTYDTSCDSYITQISTRMYDMSCMDWLGRAYAGVLIFIIWIVKSMISRESGHNPDYDHNN